jgi:secreted Zn-dependent insulinase-like peptidase
LVQGNVSKEEVLEIVEETNKILEIDINKEKTGKFHKERSVVITKNYNYIYRVKSPNPGEKSSSLISVYQTDLLNDLEFQYLKITESFLKEKFFDQMRTKETLGYIASLIMVETCGYYGLANVIQSNSKTPEFCASRVRNFYKESFNLVKNISEEEFKLHVNGQLLIVSKKDDNLNEVFLRNWNEISEEQYKFDRKEKAKENLNKCNREEFIKFYEKYFIKEIAILDSEFLSEEHYEQNEKELKENKIVEGDNIKKRIICDSLEDFKACNCLGVIYNNPVFMENNN